MYKVLVSDPISDMGIQQLHDAEDVQVDKITGLKEDELVEIIGNYDALLVRSQTKVTAKILEAAHRLKAIGRAGVGVDNIDLEAATKKGIVVVNAPDGNTIATAELSFAMMMATARMIPQAYKKTIGGEWDRKTFVGVELRGKTLGVIGMGRIGSEVAKRAKVFGMKVLGYDPFLTEERAEKLGVVFASVDDIVEQADFITVHTPLTNDTRNLLDRPQFARMKKGVRIVNCARGGIINEEALVAAVEEGIVAGAAFDVFLQEPLPADHPFTQHPNIIVTPHLGASTVEAQENVAIDVSEEVLNIMRDQPYKNAVNMPPVPAVVLNKLQPFFKLGEKLGLFVARMAEAPVSDIIVSYSGELMDLDTNPLTRYVIMGVLSAHLGSEVNLVNATHLAKSRGVNVLVQKTATAANYKNLVTVTLKTKAGDLTLAGTLLAEYGERIVQVNDFPVDIAPEGTLLLISHTDKPGIIGKVGTLLGENNVNIASMQVGRKVVGGSAIMVLTIDKHADHQAQAQLEQLEEIVKVKELTL
ncbi:phosphoglycerate dehydrogenase [Gorillibacterium sp. CAU 1737]|uniref:phosphoglycerate dehydrogenase n=1 Tax=Gorillibacterium sp. CAU 1737 TaxID=3140362 RepID=UPI00326104A8